jgi:hypothetical protein
VGLTVLLFKPTFDLSVSGNLVAAIIFSLIQVFICKADHPTDTALGLVREANTHGAMKGIFLKRKYLSG